ncbi:hypothetical protein CXB51_036280 [Gossypium anomalum]|uniref:Transmembrane protein n=1 Tax=Gossypium anomalum TaxID=47600 RepID=A0A8J5XL57_9ROSI|nr:hypothetical protein CXB51_036280 [Gossypium anomalum]
MSRCFRPFGFGGLLLLAALTASMLVLPLVLPPLPPPPLMLLFFPVGLMAALVFLAFSPTETVGNVVVHTFWLAPGGGSSIRMVKG